MLPRLRRLLKASIHVIPLSTILVLALWSWSAANPPMPSSPSPEEIASALLSEKDLDLLSVVTLQSLWAGYGQICRITATSKTFYNSPAESARLISQEFTPKSTQSYILKLITPPPTSTGDEGHTRKILSYQVEQYFYSHLAPQLPATVPYAKCLASINQHHPDNTFTTAMVLEDLSQRFSVAGEKRGVLSPTQVKAALDWLSGFHGFWWPRAKDFDRTKLVLPPLDEVMRGGQDASEKTVWLNGGYTYLATRRKEYDSLATDNKSEWNKALTDRSEVHNQSFAEMVAAFLSPTISGKSPIEDYQTLIHGDVKSENLFTNESGEQVAFYDFQYTGLGLGVCDLAKLFTCSVPLNMLVADNDVPHVLEMQDGERQMLVRYWKRLKDTSGKEYQWEIFLQHWEIALVDWLRFQASWGFWGNIEWLEARVRSILMDKQRRNALETMAGSR